MTLNELIKRWYQEGKQISNMVRIPQNVLAGLHLSEDSKRFLAEAGLMEAMYLSGTLKRKLPCLNQAYPSTRYLSTAFARYRVIGHAHMGVIQCLDEEQGGRVVNVVFPEKSDEEIIIRFVNSSIQQFAECRLAWNDCWQAMERYNTALASSQEQEYIMLYEKAIGTIDPLALADEQSELSNKLARLRMGFPF